MNACERKSYVFLRKELPVRLANIMKEIALLPDNLLRTPSVGLVSNWYAKSFEEVIDFEKSEPTSANLEKFCSTLNHIRDRHADVVQTMAHGILELKESQNDVEPGIETSIQYFLDRFYMSRISIRMLINQHSKFRSCWFEADQSFLSVCFSKLYSDPLRSDSTSDRAYWLHWSWLQPKNGRQWCLWERKVVVRSILHGITWDGNSWT